MKLPTRLSSWVFGSLTLVHFLSRAQTIRLPASYDVVWESQSKDSAGSMPLGGGDMGMGLNAWAENGMPHPPV